MNKKLAKLFKIRKIIEVYNHYKHFKYNNRKKRLWSHQWLLSRDERLLGSCALVHTELHAEDLDSYKNFLRMEENQFNLLHSLVEDKIRRNDTQFRQAISSKYRLTVTLRFLATGETFKSLSYSTRIAQSTISKFIPEVLEAIYEVLQEKYMKVPSGPEEWLKIANKFETLWNIPNTVGAMDGKHIEFRAPRSAGSHYYNYKGRHSIVLMAIVGANYEFIYIDVGANGRLSDGGVYENCDFATALNQNSLNLPNDRPLPGTEDPLPYVIIADAAFPLQRHIMKPYPFKNMTHEQRIFNYRLSRGRRVVENAFGILANRFRVLLHPINLARDKVVAITKTCCVLHNFLLAELNIADCDGYVQDDWRQNNINFQNAIFRRGRANTGTLNIREKFKDYFNGIGQVPWQNEMV